MTHLAMLQVDDDGKPATRGDHVSDDEYAAAPPDRRLSTLPFDQPGARLAFDLVVGAFVLSEVLGPAAERSQCGRSDGGPAEPGRRCK